MLRRAVLLRREVVIQVLARASIMPQRAAPCVSALPPTKPCPKILNRKTVELLTVQGFSTFAHYTSTPQGAAPRVCASTNMSANTLYHKESVNCLVYATCIYAIYVYEIISCCMCFIYFPFSCLICPACDLMYPASDLMFHACDIFTSRC